MPLSNNNTFWRILSIGLLGIIVIGLMIVIPTLNSLIDRLEIAEGAQYQSERELRKLRARIEDDTMERRLQKLEFYYQQEEQERW